MFDFKSLPLTPELSRAARNYLGFSQSKAADESDLPAHKIKRFEAGNYMPDIEFLKDLRAFYEEHGYRFDDTPEPGDNARGAGTVFPAGVVGDTDDGDDTGRPLKERARQTALHHMRIAIRDEDEMGRVLDLIEANEDRAEELLQQQLAEGFLGGYSDKCELTHVEVMKLLAENGMLWARLFGRQVGGAPDAEVLAGQARPQSHAQLLHRSQATAHGIAAGDREAIARRRGERKPPASLSESLFGLG